MFDIASVLKLLPAVGPVVAALPEFKNIYDQIVGTFKEKDQAVLNEAYEDLKADNDAGFARLDAKLAEAAKR
ncbi:hypothetical protein [Phenylobacterium sp.]|uniref:hypothetical protein n=1 Tax=Phenylobacterium sp. TaxID=1871053 RepID=UPI00286C2BF8|nr:hypothetical protein [Phenylobacterium sp.]